MEKIYDNGCKMLGQVKKIKEYNDNLYRKGAIEKEQWLEFAEELVLYDENNIVVIDYDNSMGITIDEFDYRDVLEIEKE